MGYRIGLAQEIITPPTGVGLAGYFNLRPNRGSYDDLYAKAMVVEAGRTTFAFLAYDLCYLLTGGFEALKKRIVAEFGAEFHNNLIISCTHTHTGPLFADQGMNEITQFAFEEMVDAGVRALRRAKLSLLPATLEAGSVYNNPYGFVRRYWMKDGTIVTNPGWGNPKIERPESEYDRTIGMLAVKYEGRLAAVVCNIVNHGDTIGGDIASADWYGRFAQEIQYRLGSSIPVIVLDDASGDVNHFDFHQKIHQTSYKEAIRIGRGYAAIVLDALDTLKEVPFCEAKVSNLTVEVPHRKISDAELAAAQELVRTIPDTGKSDGDFESQDLANKLPAALRYFAQRTIDCHDKSVPSHSVRLTAIALGDDLAFVSLPGEPFNGIARAIRAAGLSRQTFVIELAQSHSGYVPMGECFQAGGYEVQPGINSMAPEAADVLIRNSIKNLAAAKMRK